MRKHLRSLIAGAAVLAVLGGPMGAHATTGKGTITGVVAITGTATLPVWPTAAIQQGGTFAGNATGVIEGVTFNKKGNGLPNLYEVNLNAAPVGANYNYNEICAGPVPLLGFATGLVTVGPAPATELDTTGIVKNTTAIGHVPFTWLRVGTFAIVTDGKASIPIVGNKTGHQLQKHIHFANGDLAEDQVGSVAVATFAPTNPVPPHDCTTPGTQLATVAALDLELL